MSDPRPTPYVSVAIPVYNESESIPHLVHQLRDALAPLGKRYEIILVDDGSSDGTWEAIRREAAALPQLLGLRLSRNSGQTAALMAGIDHSRGDIVVTMDGDLQNDPADIPKLIAKIEEGNEIVSGWRKNRKDKWLSRKLPSLIANAMIRKVTRMTIHDQGCALKAYRGRVVRSVALYSEFHRFVVALTQVGGARVAEVETHHRAREFGKSKYGISRTFRVIADVTTLVMITRYSDRLLFWFLRFAVIPLVLGIAALAWTVALAAQPNPGSMLVPIGSVVLLFQCVLAIVALGLYAERIRHLAPSRWRSGDRVLANVIEAAGGASTTVLIRNSTATPVSDAAARG